MSDRSTLLEFGFPEARVDKALRATKSSGLQQALDWLDEHAGDSDIDEPAETAEDAAGGEGSEAGVAEITDDQAQSLVCNECGKQFKNEDLAQYHATKSGHTDFAQSTEAVKPLTEEEKAEKLEALQQRIREKRETREKEAKEEQRRNELLRRKAGQDTSAQQEKLKEQQMLKEIESRRRQKADDKLAAQKIKMQIEQDKRDRADRLAREKAMRDGGGAGADGAGAAAEAAAAAAPAPSMLETGPPKVAAEGDHARLQIRPMLRSGPAQPITHIFGADQTLKDVRDFVKQELPHVRHFKLSTAFPRKDFDSHHDSQTLRELGLVPNAALILTQ
ncbi:hypothetical protein LPJ61_004983 [Coemansia biformis]|uniref:UBX domain-containing protein n=1 Tax=Coemansia biformis TaxID=1286918 RepID=A0A9W8CW83_9FUNG|nr:hypothetical protein LPJ61_004983 [Coemansia biformis]